jgi:putative endonuclease
MRIANPIGRLGEDLAAEFLQKKGYTILERNFRKGYGEIDIIALQDILNSPQSSLHKRGGNTKILVFIEVKTRTSNAYGTPLEGITPKKLKELIQTAMFYKHIHRELPESLRIDAISVSLHGYDKASTIEHVENISG